MLGTLSGELILALLPPISLKMHRDGVQRTDDAST
jgi:hypothetical protein